MTDNKRQEFLDSWYWAHGPCCAGCDHWVSINSVAGECKKGAPVSGEDRAGILAIQNSSLAIGAGHAMTLRHHHCGEFADTFDWESLPPPYLKRIGFTRKDT